jgi:hypothetical protein
MSGGEIGSDQTICYNAVPATLTSVTNASGGKGTASYSWQYSTNNGYSWSTVNHNSATYTPPALTQTRQYRRAYTTDCGTVYSDPVTITVAGYTNGGEIGSDQTICYNTAPAALTSVSGASGGTGTIYYTWEYSTDGYSWSSVNHNSATYQPSAITQTTLYRRVYNTGCGTVYSYNTITVTVVEDMSGGTIGSDQTICYNEVPALLTSPVDASGGKGTTSYSWEYSTDNGSSWSTDYYNSSIYQPSALTQTTQYRRAYTSDCGTVRSDPVTITVAADMYGGTIGSDQTICYNTAPATLTSPADAGGGKGATSYSWEYSTDNGSSWVSVNHNYATYTPPAITQTTLYRRIYASDCGTVYSVNTVTVSLDAAGATIIADTVKICDGSSAELKASAPGVINPVFRWYETQTSTTPSGSGETFTTPALSTVTLVKYYVSVSGTNYCENVAGSRKEVVVIVNQYATFQQPNAILSSICAGNDPRPLTLNPTTIWGVINPIIRWYSDQTSQTPFHIGNMYMVPTLTDTTRYYISIETTNYCETLPGSRFQITIPVLQHIAASQIEASDISICYGGRGELTASAPGITNPAFMWYESQTSTEVLHSGTTFKTPSLTATTKYYVSATGLNLCENVPGDRKEVTVTVTGSSAFVDDVWYYGMNGEGIRFANSGNVHTAQDASGESKVRSHENSLVVSSPYCDGQNIFYASHNKLYNSLHEPMTNGDFTGNSSVADGLAACYMGDNKYLFFSVTNSYENGNRGLKAYTVDMNADHGKGEIVGSIDIEAASANMSESIELLTSDVLHKYWLIYAYKDGSYYHLRVREVDATDPEHPAINASVHNSITTSTMQHTYTLKSSPQHNRIAIANSDDKTVDVFDFNSTTGVLSNLRTTPVAANQRIDGLAYGVEFSPDGKQLYAAGYATGGGGAPVLCQYTITPTGLDFVERVQYWTVSNSYTSRGGGLKLGPDGRIYVMLAYDKYAGVISDADSTKTLSSRYDPTGMELNVDPSSYGLQFSTGLTRPSEMACNDNIPPATVTDETQFCITATSRTGKFNVLKNDPADGNSDRVYLTGANFKTLSDTVLAKITVNAADSTISLTIKSGVYLSTTGYVFDIVYHVKDDGSPASQCAAGTLKMTVYPTLSFADMRVRVCPGVTEVNLAKYIDTTVNVSTIKWGGIMSGAISSAGIIPVSSLLHTRVHTFTYTVNSYCTGEQTRKFYLEILKNKRSLLPKDTVVICHKYAEAIQIDQLFGIEGGTLSYPASPYIVKSSSGATVMNGKALYENDHSDVYRGESGFRIITFTYKPDAGNCLPVAEYRITIVLTG